MKKTFTLVLIALCSAAFAQDSLKQFNYSRERITGTGIKVLDSWAVANIGAGITGWAVSKGGENKYFYQMTTIWGLANLIPGYLNSRTIKNKQLTAAQSLAAQKGIERLFLTNGGLDIAYMSVGTFLKFRGDDRNSAELKGYGPAIIIQGAFLLLFDSAMYSTQRGNGNKLRRFLEKNPVTYNGQQIGIIFNM